MPTVMFENSNAIFDFELSDVIDRLKYYSGQNVHEATELLDAIASCSSPAIKVETDYFGYIVIDLIKADKGHVYCKVCKEMYDSNQLTSRSLGFGKSPFETNIKVEGGIVKRIVKNLFGKKKPKITSMRGGIAYACSEHHVLISMITWVS
jgi:hypothetical protein